jgi:hypothetical protein
VAAWYLPGEGVSAAHPGPALIYAHGNGDDADRNDCPPDWDEFMRRVEHFLRAAKVLGPPAPGPP